MTLTDGKAMPHSAQFFGDTRDYWWNADFIQLMGSRLGFDRIRSALDVGCGIGHWGRVLEPALPRDATLVGVDRESEWIRRAAQIARSKGLETRFRYIEGDALSLPFEEGSFDLVTCQTVLIHLPDARDGLREMLRVLRPGGLLLVAEPSNFSNAAVLNSQSAAWSIDEMMKMIRFKLHIERGKEALGLGNNSVGDLIPGFLAELGVADLRTYLSDKANTIFPPYSTPEHKAYIEQTFDWERKGFWAWEVDETRRYYLAGGGRSEEFESLREQAFHREVRSEAQAIRDGVYHSGGGGVSYLVSGRKPTI